MYLYIFYVYVYIYIYNPSIYPSVYLDKTTNMYIYIYIYIHNISPRRRLRGLLALLLHLRYVMHDHVAILGI